MGSATCSLGEGIALALVTSGSDDRICLILLVCVTIIILMWHACFIYTNFDIPIPLSM